VNYQGPGHYRHYKGGEYLALHLVHHHDTRELAVVYYCPTHKTLNVREYNTKGADSWCDLVQVSDPMFEDNRPMDVPRFQYIGPAFNLGL